MLFVSYGTAQQRAKVWQSADADFAVAWKRCQNFLTKLHKNNNGLPEFIKLDLAYQYQPIIFSELQQQLKDQPHNNHFRRGVAFDGKFELAFLEQELYANAIIKSEKITEPNYFDQNNLNSYLKKKYNHQPTIDLTGINNHSVILFDTFGLFIQNDAIIELHSSGMLNGSRIIEQSQFKPHIFELINANARYLHQQIQPSGKFYYGYFPAYNRTLKSYNTVRHCTSLYALIESLEVIEPIPRQSVYLTRIRQAIDYALQHLYVEIEHEQLQRGYMIDGVAGQHEIKLGANAAAILMIAKYYQLTQDQQYLPYAEKIAEGILSMIADTGETVHVLNYPALDVKEKFRIVYYDGEAAFALLRLYQINQNPQLLATVERMFEHFIAKSYWKYHDHWLSYCTNELSQIKPEAKYFEFGLNNYLKNLNFIKN
ncbi:MAG: poly alpha-glucosyltransferase, partial [Moraxellaceae bacterium]